MSTMKIALITGANKGIGFETARQLAQRGVSVLLGSRDAKRGEEAAAILKAEGLEVTPITIDVTDPETVLAAVKQVEAQYGKLDILINNAGTGDFTKPASTETVGEWKRVFDTNVFGLVETTRLFLPLLKKAEAGRIVNLSSILGSVSLAADPNSPIAGSVGHYAAYGASKTAINMYTVQLARELELEKSKIKVNVAHPGWVKTDLGGEGAPMELEEGAKTSVELALLPEDGANGGYFHLGQTLPW